MYNCHTYLHAKYDLSHSSGTCFSLSFQTHSDFNRGKAQKSPHTASYLHSPSPSSQKQGIPMLTVLIPTSLPSFMSSTHLWSGFHLTFMVILHLIDLLFKFPHIYWIFSAITRITLRFFCISMYAALTPTSMPNMRSPTHQGVPFHILVPLPFKVNRSIAQLRMPCMDELSQ
jgi:hypothetical protein